MECYWRLRDIPELSGLSKRERRRRWRESVRESRSVAEPWLFITIATCIFIAEGDIAVHLHWSFLAHGSGIVVLACAIGFIYHAWIQQPRARRWLRSHRHET